MNKNGKIGILDSGIGGITVLQEILKILPQEDFIYYSDSKNNPYGEKEDKEIQQFCDQIVQYFIQQNCKAIVLACNTASAKAVQYLRDNYSTLPIIAIEPAYKMVHDYASQETCLVMATKGTIESEKFNLLLKKYDNHKTFLLPCVGLADKIEQGKKEEIEEYLQTILSPYKDKVENVVLGCTHYPLIQEEIKAVLGNVQFFNGASSLAKQLKKVLEEKKGLKEGEGSIEFVDSQRAEEKKERFFKILKGGKFIENIKK